jgi:hypothetical protein
MTLEQLLTDLKQSTATLNFADVISTIEANYHYTPQSFDNGIGEDCVHNPAGINEGSCKVFAFGQLQNLSAEQTLACFAEHYRKVLATPEGTDHANIRTFMRHGWAGVKFLGSEPALRLK